MTEHLWTPWRMAYIKGEKKPVEGCVFCNKITADDAAEHIITRGTEVYLTLNRFPYNNGHLMIVPYEHITSQEQMSVAALTEMMIMLNQALGMLREASKPQGFNIGANIGAPAGAGIAAHYHFHIVPRWNGDANFLSVVGDTRVIPDTLDNTYQDLKAIWTKLYGENSAER